MFTLDLSFSKYLAIKEAWDVLADYSQDYSILSLLEAKEVEKYSVEMLPHIDPVTKKPWRHGGEGEIPGDRTRHLQAMKKHFTKKRKVGEKAKQIHAKDIWVAFTNVDKLGVYPRATDGQTPFGIYAFPIDYVIKKGKEGSNVPFGDRPYMQIFAVKETREKSPQKVKIMQMKTPGRQSDFPEGQFSRTLKLKDYYKAGKKGFNIKDFFKLLSYTGSEDLEKLKNRMLDRFSSFAAFSGGGKSKKVLRDHLEKVLSKVVNRISHDIAFKDPSSLENSIDETLKTLEQDLKSKPEPISGTGGPKDLQDFILRIKPSGYFDYYNEYDQKYKSVDFKKNTVLKPNGETVSIDDVFDTDVEQNWAVDEFPEMKKQWDDYKKNPKSLEPVDYEKIVDNPYWDRAVGLIAKTFKKSLKPIIKKLEQKDEELDFPFKDEIVKYADAEGLDWKRALNRVEDFGGSDIGTGRFLYLITNDLAQQKAGRSEGSEKARHWTWILRKLGIDGFADRWHQSDIFGGGGGEGTQGFFFEKGTLNHLAQVDNQGYVDRSYQTGAPETKLGNLLAKFKRENGIDPDKRIELDTFAQPLFKSLKELSELYDEDEKTIESALEGENLIKRGHIKWGHGMPRGKGEPSPAAVKNGFARLGRDEEGNVAWLWHMPKIVNKLSAIGIRSNQTGGNRYQYSVRWNVTNVMPRKQAGEIRRKYQKQAKEEIKKLKISQQKKKKQKKSKEKIYKKYNQLAREEIEEKTKIASGEQSFASDYEAEDFKTSKTYELKRQFPNADSTPGKLDIDLRRGWTEFVKNYFKKKNKVKSQEDMSQEMRDEYRDFKNQAERIASGQGEKWGGYDSPASHQYVIGEIPRSKNTGAIITPPELRGEFKCPDCGKKSPESAVEADQKCPNCERGVDRWSRRQYTKRVLYGTSTVYRTLLAIQHTFADFANRFSHLKNEAQRGRENWQNQLDNYLNQSLKLIRTLYHVRSTHQDEIDSSIDIQKIIKETETNLNQIKNDTQYVLNLGNYAELWPVFWAALKRKIEYLGKLIDGETLKFRVQKRTYISPEEYKKATRIIYPGEETIADIPEKIKETPVAKIKFVDIENFGKEAWQNLVQYQMGKGMVPGKDLFKKLYTQWDWIWDEPGLTGLPHNMKERSLDEMSDVEVLSIATNPSFIKKLVDYQVEKGLMDRWVANSRFKKLMEKYDSQKEFFNDPEFKEIPSNLLTRHAHNIEVGEALKLGRSKWKKLIKYQKAMGVGNTPEDHYENYFDVLEKSDMPENEMELVGKNISALRWTDLQNAGLDTIEKVEKFFDRIEKFGLIDNYTKKILLKPLKHLYEKGVPEKEEYSWIWENLPYDFRHGEETDLYWIKQEFGYGNIKKFDDYMRYGYAYGHIPAYRYDALLEQLKKWENEIKAAEKQKEDQLSPEDEAAEKEKELASK
jgi:hypothetical protein